MINLTKRVNKLLERTSSLECKNVCKEVLEMNNTNVPEEQLTQALVEKLKNITDGDKFVDSFVLSTEKSQKLNNLGIVGAISNIRESQSYHYPALRYTLDKFERAKINEGISDYLIVEEFLDSLKEFTWDKNVKESLDSVNEKYSESKEIVQVSKAIFEFRRSKGNFMFERICEMLEDHFENPTDASRSALIEALSKHTYSTIAKNLFENLKRIQSVGKGGLQIIAENNNCEVSPAYSTIFVENGKEYFTVKGDVFKKDANLVEKVTVEEFQTLSDNVKRSYQVLNSGNFFVKEGKASFYLGKNKIEISEADSSTKVLFNGKQIPSADIAKNLVSSGMIRLEEARVASDIQFVNDIFSNFFELDFAKVISSKIYEGSYVTMMKIDDSIYLNKVNTSMKTNEFFSNVNATQARNLVLEFLGYDIKESLSEYLDTEEAEIKSIKEKQSIIIKNMSLVEGQIEKLVAAKADAFVAAQPQISSLEEMLNKELSELKETYSEISNKLKKFEAKTSDAGVELTQDVKILSTGELATVSAIDSNTKKVTLVKSDGKSVDLSLDEIASVSKEEEMAMKRNEVKSDKEAEKEPAHQVEESKKDAERVNKDGKEEEEDLKKIKDKMTKGKKNLSENEEALHEDTPNISPGGNKVPVENPNKDDFPSQEPEGQPAKVQNDNPEYVPGKVDDKQDGSCAGKDVEVLAADYASKGPEDLIQVRCDGDLYFIEKKYLEVSSNESSNSLSIDFDAKAPGEESKPEKSEKETETPTDKGSSDDAPKEEVKETPKDEKPKEEEEPEETTAEKLEKLQKKLSKALRDVEDIKDDMKESNMSEEDLTTLIESLNKVTEAIKKNSEVVD